MKSPKWKDIVGKTIKSVNSTSVNYIVLSFTDGTQIGIEGVHAGHGIHGFELVAEPQTPQSNHGSIGTVKIETVV